MHHGADQVDDACRRALEAEAVNVGLIDRMPTRGHAIDQQRTGSPPGAATRFVRDTTYFAKALMSTARHSATTAPKRVEVPSPSGTLPLPVRGSTPIAFVVGAVLVATIAAVVVARLRPHANVADA